jgi:hypothetical protein
MIDAWHLPGLERGGDEDFVIREYGGGVTLRFPRLDAPAMEALLERLRGRGERLSSTPVARLVEVIDEAAARLTTPGAPLRRLAEQALPAVTGYSPAMVALILDRMGGDWRAPALHALLRAELGEAGVLDGFAARPGRAGRTRVYGPALAFHVFAGNVPGVAVTSLIRSLLVKAPTLGKTAAGEPLLAALFARAVAEVDEEIGAALAVTHWSGGDEALEAPVLRQAELIVFYGGAAAETELRRRLPDRARLVSHGPRFSLALVGRAALSRAALRPTAAHAARAIATFDQQGCVSPHAVYVETGGDATAEEFAACLAEALAALEGELPRGRLSPGEASAIHQLRGAAEFRELAGAGTRLLGDGASAATVVYEPDPAFVASCLNRFVRVHPVASLEEAIPHFAAAPAQLQTVGVAGAGRRLDALAHALAGAGATRVTSLEAMAWPPPTWHHDGRPPLGELLRWVDLES